MRNIAKKVSSHLKWRLLPRMISDVRLLGRPAKNADPYATLEALERLSRAATGIILIGIALELAWGIWTFENWPSFLAMVIPDTLIVLGLAIEFLAIGRVIVAENEARSLSEQETAAAKERAAVAEQKANEARLELAKFRQPWGLSKEQWTRLRQKLIPFGQIDFEIAAQGNDPLAGSFADEIEQNLQAIGWRQLDWKDGVLVTKRLGMPVRGIISASGFHIFFRENLPWAGPAERSRRA